MEWFVYVQASLGPGNKVCVVVEYHIFLTCRWARGVSILVWVFAPVFIN